MNDLPLDGVTVIDLTRAMAGPFCTMMLGDMGADVIKVEPLEGDESRSWKPPSVNGVSTYFLSVNRNKRSIAINLKDPEGVRLLHRLIEGADVLVENFRPSVTSRLGADYETVRRINPRIIYCSISGFGQWGPYSSKPGYDLIALAMSGHMSLTGERTGPPVKFSVPIADITTGMYAAFSIVTALLLRGRRDEPIHLDVSLLDVQVSLLTHQATEYLATSRDPVRMGSAHPSIAPYQAVKLMDGYVVIGVANDRFWKKFCETIGAEHLSSDPRFSTNELRVKNRDELIREVETLLRSKSTIELVEELDSVGIPVAPVKKVSEVLSDEHVLARGMLESVYHNSLGTLTLLSHPVLYNNIRPRIRLPPPLLGEQTDEILRGLGYSEEDIIKLRDKGVVR
ncbi:MAG: CoA transferase [Aigarchaeota archaeon]|nr:CoA transferase [Aigarchaeota archaeon]MDW8092422.1 CaiB/BaiF CoA-transferase family protein [Nitrososphaerota archaeon]